MTLLHPSAALVAVTLLAAAAAAEPAAERVAAYGRVSPGDGPITVIAPYYQGAPQTVVELLVKEGEWVTRGQKLAVLRSERLADADLAVAESHLAAAEARLEAVNAEPKGEDIAAQQAQIDALEADARAEKARKAPDTTAGKNEASAREDASLARVASARHQLAATQAVRPADRAVAQAAVDEARAEVSRAEALKAAASVEAPMAGQVLRIIAHSGEGASESGLVELGDTKAMVVLAELNAANARQVKVGAKATITSEAWAGAIAGTVTRISQRVSRSNLTALSTFANVDRQTVEATVTPEAPEGLAGLTGAETTVLIGSEPPAK